MADANPAQTCAHVVDVLKALRVGYLHVMEAAPGQAPASVGLPELFSHPGATWNGVYIVNRGYDAARGEQADSSDRADAVAYGRLFLANPDLPKRLQYGGPLNAADPTSCYGGTERGDVDYPSRVEEV